MKAQTNGPTIVKYQPLFSIRYILAVGVHLFHTYIIPRTDHRNRETGEIVKQVYGDKETAMKYWKDLVDTHTLPDGQEVKECELLYGGDLVKHNTVVVGAQVIERWDTKSGYRQILVPPELAVDPEPADQPIEEIDATLDGDAASTPAPVIDTQNAHIATANKVVNVPAVLDGSPHVEKVEVPVQESGPTIATVPVPEIGVTEASPAPAPAPTAETAPAN